MPTPSYIGFSQASATAQTVTVNRPTGVVTGDVLLAWVSAYTGTFTMTGWTKIGQAGSNGITAALFSRTVQASEPSSYTVSSTVGSSTIAVDVIAVRDAMLPAVASTGIQLDSDSFFDPSITTSDQAFLACFAAINASPSSFNLVSAGGFTERFDFNYGYSQAGFTRTVNQAGTYQLTFNTSGQGSGNQYPYVLLALPPSNTPPNAPTLTTLTGGEVIDRAAANRASHSFSDPDAGDSQSAFDHRYRLVGSSAWTEAYAATPNGFVDYPAGTFAAGDYERQVRTYDSQGAAGPWSPSGFFTAGDAPPTPTITDPIQNETISDSRRDVTWSAPDQDAYQLQVLDGGLVVHDTGTVTSTQRTAYGVPFPDNNATRSVRVRVRSGGLWSTWYTISVTVSYTPPPLPSVVVTASGAALVVQVTNPAPAAGEPAVTQNDVFVTEDGVEQRRAVVTPNGSWTYWLPKAGLDYAQLVRVEAIGDNGTRSSS